MLDRAELLDLPDIAAWIVEAGVEELPARDLVDGAMQRLRARGVPVDRAHIAFRVLHPLFDGMSLIWSAEHGIAPEPEKFSEGQNQDYQTSPFYHLLSKGLRELRLVLPRDPRVDAFPFVARMRDEGHTDYLAAVVAFGGAALHPYSYNGIGTTWATRDPGGFSDEDLAEIRRTLRPLALSLRLSIKDQIMRTALDTFHGPMVGARILSGAIKRGAGERIRAAIWFSDLRNSTGLADALSTEDFLALLNAYFDCAAGAVAEAGGHVLDIVGDAVLAIFPADADTDEAHACASALAAARASHARLAALRATANADVLAGGAAGNNRAHSIAFGVGIHFGDVVFGNAGTPDRLKFSCHGGSVNEAARLAETAKHLGRPFLASEAVAAYCSDGLTDCGHHTLRGFPAARRLWG